MAELCQAPHPATYRGSCECGTVRYEVVLELTRAPACGDSVWERAVPLEALRLLAGDESLCGYQFADDEAEHFFCERCGVRPFSRHRAAPRGAFYSIDLKSLDTRAAASAPDRGTARSGHERLGAHEPSVGIEAKANSRHLL